VGKTAHAALDAGTGATPPAARRARIGHRMVPSARRTGRDMREVAGRASTADAHLHAPPPTLTVGLGVPVNAATSSVARPCHAVGVTPALRHTSPISC
jgi:hypothetical protein